MNELPTMTLVSPSPSEISKKAPDAPPAAPRRKWLRWLIWFLVLHIPIAVGGYLVYRFYFAHPAAPKVVALSGRIEGDDSAVAPKVTGRILEIRFREGDSVKAGEVIAILDDPQVHAREQQARDQVNGGRSAVVVGAAADRRAERSAQADRAADQPGYDRRRRAGQPSGGGAFARGGAARPTGSVAQARAIRPRRIHEAWRQTAQYRSAKASRPRPRRKHSKRWWRRRGGRWNRRRRRSMWRRRTWPIRKSASRSRRRSESRSRSRRL